MTRLARWMMALFGGRQNESAQQPQTVDRLALREQMTREDPEYARVRRVHHDAIQPLVAKGIRDGIALRHEREWWQRHGGQAT